MGHEAEKQGKALEGVKILDLTHYIAGPFCTKLLAGLGAEVIKVEKPGTGDGARKIPPFLGDDPDLEKSGLFLYLNTNKRGITINLKDSNGLKMLKELVKQVDVLVENFQPRVLPSLGLSYNELTKLNPRLVLTSISNFGQNGPYRDWKASEITEYAMSGLMYITGEPEREPLKLGTHMAQYVAGQYASAVTLGALYHARMAGKSHHVDISIMECNVALLEFQMAQYLYRGYISQRVGQANEKGHPHGMMPCRNGVVALSVWPPGRWKAIAEITGISELLDEKFSTNKGRIDNRDELNAYLLPWLMDHDREEIVKAWQAQGLPASWVHNVAELIESSQLKAREYFIQIDHPVAGNLLYPGAPFKMSRASWQAIRAPLLGEYNQAVYSEYLGMSSKQLTELKTNGVI